MKNFMKPIINAIKYWTNSRIEENKAEIDERISNSKADWNQNNPEADNYVKNRTHWEEEKKTVLVDNLTSGDYGSENTPQCTFIPGTKYIVIWNGVTYDNLECFFDGEFNIIATPENGYPFYIDDDGGNGLYIDHTEDSAEWTVSIIEDKTVVHPLDAKYLPTEGFPQSDWNESDENSQVYINNKPFYEKINVLFEGICEMDQYGGCSFETRIELQDDETYMLTINDDEYTGVAYYSDTDGMCCDFYGSGAYIASLYANYIYIGNYSNTTCRLKVSTYKIRQLDSKYIPNEVLQVQSNWDEIDTASKSYILNKPEMMKLETGTLTMQDTQNSWLGMVYADGKFVAVSREYSFVYNGVKWTRHKLPLARNWTSMVYGNNMIVLADGQMIYTSYRTYLYSTDGITWTTGNIPYTDKIYGMAYGNGKFVAVNGNSVILYSNDGISWARNYTAIPSGNYSKVVFGNNRFVAKDVSKANVAYSDDGITWTLSTTNYDVHNEVLYCRDRFMIFYNNNTVDYSYDGITWTLINIPSLDTYEDWRPAYGNDKFIAIGRNTNIAIYSDDGVNWEKTPLPLSAAWSHIAYGNNKFIAIGDRLLTPICSYDGIHWKTTDVYITQGSQDKTTNIKELLLDGYATEEYVDSAMAKIDVSGVVRYDESQDLTTEERIQVFDNSGLYKWYECSDSWGKYTYTVDLDYPIDMEIAKTVKNTTGNGDIDALGDISSWFSLGLPNNLTYYQTSTFDGAISNFIALKEAGALENTKKYGVHTIALHLAGTGRYTKAIEQSVKFYPYSESSNVYVFILSNERMTDWIRFDYNTKTIDFSESRRETAWMDKTFSSEYDGHYAESKAVGEALATKITSPTTAAVGQTIVVKSVDENNKPTEWECTTVEETDPTVPDWAKQPEKPTYTPDEIGAQPAGSYLTEDNLSGYATENFVSAKIAEAELSGGDVDLSGYATKDDIPTKTSQLTNDSGFLTQHQDLTDYAKKTDIPDVPVQSVNGKTGTVTLGASDVGALPNTTVIPTVPTKVSAFTNDAGYLTEHQSLAAYAKTADLGDLAAKDTVSKTDLTTDVQASLGKADTALQSYTETDPTVPAWAKAAKKPTYTASEVGALPSTTKIPSKLSDLTDDSTHRTVTDTEKSTWSAKVDTSSLTAAVNDALLQAKESGEFDGESGVYVGSGDMPEGYSVQIDPSGDADIEVLTAEETKALIVEEVAKRGQLQPEFANSIAECTDTSKLYVLPDGYIYAFTSGGTQEVFTDVLKDVGYKENHRINSSGNIVATDAGGPDTTNHIPCKAGDIIRMKNVDFPSAYTSGKYWNLVGAYDANKTHKKQTFVVIDDRGNWQTLGLIEENGIVVQFTIEPSVFGTDIAYIAINAREITAESEIYVNSTLVSVDAWVNTGLAFVQADYEDRIATIEKEISDLGGSIVPDYVIEEAEATIAKVFSHGNYGRTIRFIAISDTHEDSAGTYNPQVTVSNRHAGQAIKYIADRIGVDFVAHLGDASSRGAWTTTQEFGVLCDDVMNINKFVFSGLRNINTVFIPGNHDMMSLSGNQLLNSGAYILFGNMCSGMKDRLGGYGFFDIEDAKIRVIYLNTSDSPSAAAYLALTQEQKNWLCETMLDVNAKDDADEWKMILLSHAPLDFGGAKISEDILLPYVNGGVYGAYDFANKNKAKIMCNIHGHVHCFSYGYMEDKIRRFSVPNACFIGSNHYGSRTEYAAWADTTTYNKTANSGKDTSFSLVTIDLDSGMCYADNYGAGIDREFSTDYNVETVKHTNRILSSQESDGTPYNGGTGYKLSARLNSSGVEKTQEGVVVSGFIPYNGENIEIRIPNMSTSASYNYVHLYNENFAAILKSADGATIDGSYHQFHYWANYGGVITFDEATKTQKIEIPKESIHSDTRYIRISAVYGGSDGTSTTVSADTFDVALNESVDN